MASFDKDYYVFELLSAHRVDVHLTNIPDGQDYDVALRDADLTLIARSDDWGQADEHIAAGVLPSGQYYIQVYHYDSGGSTQPYNLRAVYDDGP